MPGLVHFSFARFDVENVGMKELDCSGRGPGEAGRGPGEERARPGEERARTGEEQARTG